LAKPLKGAVWLIQRDHQERKEEKRRVIAVHVQQSYPSTICTNAQGPSNATMKQTHEYRGKFITERQCTPSNDAHPMHRHSDHLVGVTVVDSGQGVVNTHTAEGSKVTARIS
jgi:hypothetical protein